MQAGVMVATSGARLSDADGSARRKSRGPGRPEGWSVQQSSIAVHHVSGAETSCVQPDSDCMECSRQTHIIAGAEHAAPEAPPGFVGINGHARHLPDTYSGTPQGWLAQNNGTHDPKDGGCRFIEERPLCF